MFIVQVENVIFNSKRCNEIWFQKTLRPELRSFTWIWNIILYILQIRQIRSKKFLKSWVACISYKRAILFFVLIKYQLYTSSNNISLLRRNSRNFKNKLINIFSIKFNECTMIQNKVFNSLFLNNSFESCHLIWWLIFKNCKYKKGWGIFR